MKKLLFISNLLACILIGPAFAQTSIKISGIIYDKERDCPLSYVSVGILNKPLGSVSDSLGNFSFDIQTPQLADTLQISRVGYYTLRIMVKDFVASSGQKIQLTENPARLQEVVVTSEKQPDNSEIIGRQGSRKLTQLSIHHKTSAAETIGSEMGMLYKIDRPGALLKDFNFYISANNFNAIKFRINIYSVKNDFPDSLISDREIFTTLDNFRTGWTKIDLADQRIHVRDAIIVTVQWIESRQDKPADPVTIVPVAMSLFSKNCYVRIASQDRWQKKAMKMSHFITIAY